MTKTKIRRNKLRHIKIKISLVISFGLGPWPLAFGLGSWVPLRYRYFNNLGLGFDELWILESGLRMNGDSDCIEN